MSYAPAVVLVLEVNGRLVRAIQSDNEAHAQPPLNAVWVITSRDIFEEAHVLAVRASEHAAVSLAHGLAGEVAVGAPHASGITEIAVTLCEVEP